MRASGKRFSGWKKEWPTQPPWAADFGYIKYSVTVPIRTRSITNWHVNHWVNSTYVKKVRKAVLTSLIADRKVREYLDNAREVLRSREGQALVRLTRFGPQVMDDDNLRGSLKAVRDTVAAHLEVDDGDRSRIVFDYHQAKGEYAVRVDVAVKLVVPILVTV